MEDWCWLRAVVSLSHLSLTTVMVAALPTTLGGQETVTFSGMRWTITGEARVERHLEREALRMGNGRAVLEGVEFEDGTIEFDFATTGHRSFAGAFFRIQETNRDGEYVYLRPHQSDRFDALQYTPTDSGMTAWQLYPEYNAATTIPTHEWLPVRLEVSGGALEVFVGSGPEPVMTAQLQRPPAGGGIALVSSALRGGGIDSPEGTLTTAFANVAVRVRAAATSGDQLAQAMPSDGRLIHRWALSPAFPVSSIPVARLPDEARDSAGWIVATGDASGRLNISRFRAMPQDADMGVVLARVILRSDREQWKPMHFGFSDAVSVFLNGQALYSADNRYLARSGRYLGVMTLENDVLSLPLKEGDNELVLAVSEVFGGWGVTARLGDLDGVSVVARAPQ